MEQTKRIVLFGNGGFATAIYAYIAEDSDYEVVAFTVDRAFHSDAIVCGLPVVPFDEVEDRYPPQTHGMLIALGYRGMNLLRAEKCREAKEKGYRLASYTSSRALVPRGVEVGENCFIMGDTVVEPFARIGNNVHIGSGSHIGHHSVLYDHCFLAAHVAVAGAVTVGHHAFLGVNSTIRNGIAIAPASVVGAGAVVIKDTKEGGVYLGNPARLLPTTSDQLQGAF